MLKLRSWLCLILGYACFLLPSVHAADVYYIGAASATSASAENSPGYSLSQRIKDLFDFSTQRKNDTQRSGRISGSFFQEVDHNAVSGNKAKSFLREGWDYLSELHVNIQEKLVRDYNFEGQWFIRKTDNPRIETRRDARLKQINVKVYNPRNLFEFGDFYGDFSQFVLGTSLEGFNIEAKPTDAQTYKVVAGRSQKADPTSGKFQRNIFGLKADYNLFPDSSVFNLFRIGLQAATAQDDSSTIDRIASSKDLRNIVGSIDGEFSLKKYFSLAYELARSGYIEDEDSSSDDSYGNALRVQPALDLGRVSLRYLYYYVQPKFYSDVGSASSDKIQHQLTADITLHEKAMMTVSENYYWDHLEGSTLTKRTTNNEQYLAFNLRPFDNRPDFMFRPYANYQTRHSDDLSDSAGGITRTFGFSLNDTLEEATAVGVSYEYRGFTDLAAHATSDYFHRIGVSYARDWQVLNRRLYCSLDPSVDLRQNKADDDMDTTVNAGFNAQYDLSSRLVARAGNTFTDSNGAKVASDFDNNRAYWEFDYVVDKERSSHLVLRGERNRYGSEDENQNYLEQRFVLKFLTNF